MIFDTHMHTEFSFDSSETLQNILAEAKRKNLGVITTEHKDLNNTEVDGFPIDFDVQEYFKRYLPFRSENYLIGIELGLDLDYTEELRRVQEAFEFDMVIGSLHTMKKNSLSSRKYYKGKDYREFYRDYLTYAKEMVLDNPYINSLAHLDYPTRYSGFPNLKYDEFKKEFDELFHVMLLNEVSLELNLKRPLEGDVLLSFRSIFTGYRDQGGKSVTLASDAHIEEDIGRNFEDALRLMDEIGLEICYYKERKRMICNR